MFSKTTVTATIVVCFNFPFKLKSLSSRSFFCIRCVIYTFFLFDRSFLCFTQFPTAWILKNFVTHSFFNLSSTWMVVDLPFFPAWWCLSCCYGDGCHGYPPSSSRYMAQTVFHSRTTYSWQWASLLDGYKNLQSFKVSVQKLNLMAVKNSFNSLHEYIVSLGKSQNKPEILQSNP